MIRWWLWEIPTESGAVLFAKNSDRQSDEPHIMIRIARKGHNPDQEPTLQLTYIKIPQVQDTYETVLRGSD